MRGFPSFNLNDPGFYAAVVAAIVAVLGLIGGIVGISVGSSSPGSSSSHSTVVSKTPTTTLIDPTTTSTPKPVEPKPTSTTSTTKPKPTTSTPSDPSVTNYQLVVLPARWSDESCEVFFTFQRDGAAQVANMNVNLSGNVVDVIDEVAGVATVLPYSSNPISYSAKVTYYNQDLNKITSHYQGEVANECK